jgi:xylan 1,4-beta-xylosidase
MIVGLRCADSDERWLSERMRVISLRVAVLLLVLSGQASALAQNEVTVRVNVAQKTAPFRPIYGYFGYDEPNVTYTKNGSKLIGELVALTDAPVHLRTHFLLATGDGTSGLKWGSTNAYTEDASGRAVYDWTVLDRIFDTYKQAHARPFVEIGFMPEALSSKPEPYQSPWIPGTPNKNYAVGWSYPPSDYEKWGELVYQWARHSAERYGREEAESWYWEVWNEPDIFYWHGTLEEYLKLYDYAVAGLRRALPKARVGGPATTGPASQGGATFLNAFLAHCSAGKNYVTGGTGAPLDFVSYHAKGSPEVIEGHVRMGLARHLRDVEAGLKILSAYPKFHNLPVILSESDPEGCAACSARQYPQNAYRNGPLYAAYTAAAMKGIMDLSARNQGNIAGMLTWAFEFEGQPYFEGFRTLATNGVDKPILNFFRFAGLMRGARVDATSSGAIPMDSILAHGVRENPDIDVLAASDNNGVSILIWNYFDDDSKGRNAPIALSVQGLPAGVERILMKHYRIDATHSNAYSFWKGMGSLENPTPEQQKQIEAAGQLQLLDSPNWLWNQSGKVTVTFDLPEQAVSLIRLDW